MLQQFRGRTYLYTALQSPMENPDRATRDSLAIRVLRIDRPRRIPASTASGSPCWRSTRQEDDFDLARQVDPGGSPASLATQLDFLPLPRSCGV